jgi:HTH-type transcriptional regulator/antitoxin HigA
MATVIEETNRWAPDWATHPGEHLAEYLEVRGWSQAEFARLADLTPKLVSDIINGKNPVTPDTAIKLERVLGLKDYIWLGLQRDWDLHQARQRASEVVPEQKSWLARFPIKEMKAQRLLPDTTSEGTLLDALLRLLGLGDPVAYVAKCHGFAVQHRQSQSFESSPDHVFTWLMLGEQRARAMNLPPFNEATFLKAVREIRGLTREDPKIFQLEMKRLCHEAGVGIIFMKPLGQTRLFGSAWWIDGNQRAVIQMSLRMKTNDHFWWTFFHECGHIMLHRGKNFADDQNASGDGPEAEADRWAETIIYGHKRLSSILADPPVSDLGVRRLADELNLHPGIVVGMLQHYEKLPYRNLNHLKARFQWADEVNVGDRGKAS